MSSMIFNIWYKSVGHSTVRYYFIWIPKLNLDLINQLLSFIEISSFNFKPVAESQVIYFSFMGCYTVITFHTMATYMTRPSRPPRPSTPPLLKKPSASTTPLLSEMPTIPETPRGPPVPPLITTPLSKILSLPMTPPQPSLLCSFGVSPCALSTTIFMFSLCRFKLALQIILPFFM